PFHLYVPASSIDTARRLVSDLQIPVAEIWAYNALGDQMRFTLVQRLAHGSDGKGRSVARPGSAPAARRVAAAKPRAGRPVAAARPVRRATVAKKSKAPTRAAATRTKASSASKPQKRK